MAKKTIEIETMPDTSKLEDSMKELAMLQEKVRVLTLEEKERQEKALQTERVLKLNAKLQSVKTLEAEIDWFMKNAPFNNNMSFLNQCKNYFTRLDLLEKLDIDKESSAGISEARRLASDVLSSGNTALTILGSPEFRYLVSNYSKTLEVIEKRLSAIEKVKNNG